MTNHPRPDFVVHPEDAMAKVQAWTDSRVVGERAATRLEILAAFGVHLGLSASSREITVDLGWRDPSCVELTIAWSPSRDGAADDPEPYVADALTVLTKEWTLHDTRHAAELVCIVEDTGSDDRSDQAEAARAALTDGRRRMAPQTA
ncbi:hypothetical protein [Jiangella mangrovi]|uniref:Uncharacterized protein n=1 Tax=Jiangella mangrovi TaxID=1524084 RepID=A0A7W9GV86_9ACTN|nr:hypothetical protein [Jiangella mangrovi]MBB5790351.1 hypothetical protein [Jiangella mangrovi]